MIVPQDIDEDGRFDMIVQKVARPGESKNSDIEVIYNNLAIDAFYFKSTMVYSHGDSEPGESSKNWLQSLLAHNTAAIDKHYADMALGASFRFVATDIDDVKSVRTGS